jgi:predicted nucleic acid-binding protein
MMSVEMRYVVDTNALIWYLTADTQLTTAAKAIFNAAEHGETRLILPAIVIAELYYLNQKRGLYPKFRDLYEQFVSKPYFRIIPFKHEAVLDFDRNASVPEMHDRIIVGLARHLNAPLITSDRAITASGLVPIVW